MLVLEVAAVGLMGGVRAAMFVRALLVKALLMKALLMKALAGTGMRVGDRQRHLGRQPTCGIAHRKCGPRRKHAKQVEQGDQPPCLGPLRFRQAYEHRRQSIANRRLRQGAGNIILR